MVHIYSEDEIEHIIIKTNHFINEHLLNYNKAIKRIICKGSIKKETIDDYRNAKNCTFDEYIETLLKFDKNADCKDLISVHNDFHKLTAEVLSRYLTSRPISETLFNNLYFSHVTLINLLNEIINNFNFKKNQLDKLTNTWNREIFSKFIEREYLEMKRGKPTFSLVYFDVDHFKEINDNYNHNIGDFILRDLIKLIKSYLREYDSISRWGGDEFLILFPDTTLPEAVQVISRIKQIINRRNFIYEAKEINVSCSFGIAPGTLEKDIEKIIDEADSLLYLAKKNGRDRIEFSDYEGELSPS